MTKEQLTSLEDTMPHIRKLFADLFGADVLKSIDNDKIIEVDYNFVETFDHAPLNVKTMLSKERQKHDREQNRTNFDLFINIVWLFGQQAYYNTKADEREQMALLKELLTYMTNKK